MKLIDRLHLLGLCEQDEHARRAAMLCAAADPIWWCDRFVWGEDPRPDAVRLIDQIITWPAQEAYLRAVCGPRSLVVDKSRDQGVSWLGIAGFVWGAIFCPGATYGIASRSGAEVWDGTTGSLLGKAKAVLERLPPWMAPEWELRRSSPQSILLANGSSIVGHKTVPDAFRGPRYRKVWVDEAAVVPRLDEVLTSAIGSGSPVLLTGTPRGRAGYFARLVHGEAGVVVKPFAESADGWAHIRLHYRDDPRKTAAIVARLRADHTPEQWAQEYEIDYCASTPGRIWPEFARGLHVLDDRAFAAELRDSRGWTVYEAWDQGLHTAVVWVAVDHQRERAIVLDGLQWYAATHEQVARDVADHRGVLSPQGWRTRANPAGRLPDRRVGDPALGARQGGTARSWADYLRDDGIAIEWRGISGRVEELQQRVRLALIHERLAFAPECLARRNGLPSVVESVEAYRRRVRSDGLVMDEAEKLGEAGAASHYADALQYALDWAWPRATSAAWWCNRGSWEVVR